jgi:hypothetical protein
LILFSLYSFLKKFKYGFSYIKFPGYFPLKILRQLPAAAAAASGSSQPADAAAAAQQQQPVAAAMPLRS